jgi:hypothetical protein
LGITLAEVPAQTEVIEDGRLSREVGGPCAENAEEGHRPDGDPREGCATVRMCAHCHLSPFPLSKQRESAIDVLSHQRPPSPRSSGVSQRRRNRFPGSTGTPVQRRPPTSHRAPFGGAFGRLTGAAGVRPGATRSGTAIKPSAGVPPSLISYPTPYPPRRPCCALPHGTRSLVAAYSPTSMTTAVACDRADSSQAHRRLSGWPHTRLVPAEGTAARTTKISS